MTPIKILLLLICILSVFSIYFCFPAISQDGELPVLVINGNDFPFHDGKSVLMVKQLWGDKNGLSFESSILSGGKETMGKNAQVLKTFDTNGEYYEDYFIKNDTLMYMGTTRENWDKLVPAKNIIFPLKLNTEWTVVDKDISGKHVLITCRVVSHEFVQVPAGIFQSLKIDTTSKIEDKNPVKNSHIWIVPGKGIVKEIQQLDENLTQIRELVYIQGGNQSLLSMAGSIPSGGTQWKGSGKSVYRGFAQHPKTDKTMEQNVEISYNFSFTIDPQSNFIKGQGDAKITNYKNTNGKSIDGNPSSTFSFIGKKDGDTLKFFDGCLSVKSGSGEIPAIKILDQAFQLSAKLNGNSAKANLQAGNKNGTYMNIQWQATQQ